MRFRPLVLAVALLVAAGCGADDGPDGAGPPTTSTSTTSTTSTSTTTTTAPGPTTSTTGVGLAGRCTSEESGYAVGYPAGWSTNDGTVAAPCRYFHPEPFEVPEATEVIGLAVTISVEPEPFARVAGPDTLGEEELSREATTVAGRPAVRVEAVSTGEVLLPEGVRTARYAVDLGGRTLVAVTHDVEGLDFAANRAVLDAMVASLELLPGR